MSDWFSPEVGRLFSLFSLLSLLALVAPWVQRGKHKALVTALYIAGLGLGVVLLVAGGVARWAEQPAYVVRPLSLAGLVITVVFAVMIGVVLKGYAEAEQRKMLARDI